MGYSRYGYGMMNNGWGWIMMIGFFIFVVFVGFVLFKYMNKSGQRTCFTSGSSALGILKERYAKGEITDEQYKKMKEEILRD